MEDKCVFFKVRCSVEFIFVCIKEWWLFPVLVALLHYRWRIKINITLPSSQLDSAVFTIRLTSLNYYKLSVNCLPTGIRDTGKTLVWSWYISGMLLRSATACVGGSSRLLALSICVTRLLPFIVWLWVKVTQDFRCKRDHDWKCACSKKNNQADTCYLWRITVCLHLNSGLMIPLWLAGVPSCDASAPCYVHGPSGLVSRNALISGLKNQEHHLDFPPVLTNA